MKGHSRILTGERSNCRKGVGRESAKPTGDKLRVDGGKRTWIEEQVLPSSETKEKRPGKNFCTELKPLGGGVPVKGRDRTIENHLGGPQYRRRCKARLASR